MIVKISNGPLDYTATVEYDEGGVSVALYDSDPERAGSARTHSATLNPTAAKALAALLMYLAIRLGT